MEVPGGIEPRTILPPLRTRLEDEGWDRDQNLGESIVYSFITYTITLIYAVVKQNFNLCGTKIGNKVELCY